MAETYKITQYHRRPKKTLRLFVLTALVFAAVSCSDSAPSASVLAGNMAYGRGSYQKAILQYLSADEHQGARKDVVLYNLANVYYALGEGDAALESWSRAEESTGDVDILFRIAFNRAVLYYNWGRYDEAYRSFRRALILRPNDIDAKINLEESLSRIRAVLPSSSTSTEIEQKTFEQSSPDSLRLLDYIKRKEVGAWSSTADEQSEFAEDW